MAVTGIFTNKGGVGKSSFSTNLGHALAMSGKRVLIIDLDPQCDSSNLILGEAGYDAAILDRSRSSVSDILKPVWRGEGYIAEVAPHYAEAWGFSIIPGSIELGLHEDLLSGDWKSAQAADLRGLRTTGMFAHLVSLMRADFDEILIDCNPSLSAINRAALLACDGMVSPVSSDAFSARSLFNMSKWFDRWTPQWSRALEMARDDGDDPDDLFGFKAPQAPRFMGVVPVQTDPRHQFDADALGRLSQGTTSLATSLGQLNEEDEAPDYTKPYAVVPYDGQAAQEAQHMACPYSGLPGDASGLADCYRRIAAEYLERTSVFGLGLGDAPSP